MAQLTICDVCSATIKDNPINIEIVSNNKVFGKKKEESGETPSGWFLMSDVKKWNFEKDFELCEMCGLSLLKIIEEARNKADIEIRELRKAVSRY